MPFIVNNCQLVNFGTFCKNSNLLSFNKNIIAIFMQGTTVYEKTQI